VDREGRKDNEKLSGGSASKQTLGMSGESDFGNESQEKPCRIYVKNKKGTSRLGYRSGVRRTKS